MNIVIVGCGKVGECLAETLNQEGHNIAIVDKDEAVVKSIATSLDVIGVTGNGAMLSVLQEADVAHADLFIAVTNSDEVNMLSCLLAKKEANVDTIARIRNPEYEKQVEYLKDELNLARVINPEKAVAKEILRLLHFPSALEVQTFSNGRVEMIKMRIPKKSGLCNVKLKDLHKVIKTPALICVLQRGNEIIIPSGDTELKENDAISFVAKRADAVEFCKECGLEYEQTKGVILIGGGKISYYLAKIIVPMGIRVTMIEKNPEKAARLSEQMPHVNLLCGDATDQELLEQEGIRQVDAFVALGDRDEENLMTGLFASHIGVPKVVVKNNRVIYADVINAMGLDSIVSPKDITSGNILRYVRARINSNGTKVEKLYRLVNGKAEALEFLVRPNDPYIGIPLKNLHMRPDTLVAIIVRKGKVIIPFGNDQIEGGDTVVIMARESGLTDLNEIISVS